MNTTQITVTYERKFSDGNYGSEGLSLTYTASYEIGEDLAIDEDMIGARGTTVAGILRATVLGELVQSGSERVSDMARRELNHRLAWSEPPQRDGIVSPQSAELEEVPF